MKVIEKLAQWALAFWLISVASHSGLIQVDEIHEMIAVVLIVVFLMVILVVLGSASANKNAVSVATQEPPGVPSSESRCLVCKGGPMDGIEVNIGDEQVKLGQVIRLESDNGQSHLYVYSSAGTLTPSGSR